MNTQLLNGARRFVIIEALIDYMEQCYEESGKTDDIVYLVNAFFDDFVQWAYDDIIISQGERDLLLNGHERELNEGIKKEAVRSFSYISGL